MRARCSTAARWRSSSCCSSCATCAARWCSIVVLENIFRRRNENHEQAKVAAVRGSEEVASAIIASTITTLVIFLPLVFVRGVSAMLFKDLALVVVFALVASLAVSLSMVPMLSARLLQQRTSPGERRGLVRRLGAAADAGFDALDRGYRDLLRGVLRHRGITVLVSLLLLGSSLLLAPRIGSEFMPPSDEGEVRVSGELEAGLRLDLADVQARRMEAIIDAAVPEAVSVVASVSAAGRGGDAVAEAEADVRLNVGPSTSRTPAR